MWWVVLFLWTQEIVEGGTTEERCLEEVPDMAGLQAEPVPP